MKDSPCAYYPDAIIVNSLLAVGLAKEHKLIQNTEETDMIRALDKLCQNYSSPLKYKMNVLPTNATFQHIWSCMIQSKRKQVRLCDPLAMGTNIALCYSAGNLLDAEMALNLTVGDINAKIR